MRVSNQARRKLTELDFVRLSKFTAAGAAPQLADVLDEAEVLPSQGIPCDVVTMYAQFTIRELESQRSQVLVICYPDDAEPAEGYISVLSPAGMALLGLPVGSTGRWCGPGGAERVVHIEGILFQPEASGDYVT